MAKEQNQDSGRSWRNGVEGKVQRPDEGSQEEGEVGSQGIECEEGHKSRNSRSMVK